MSLLHLWTLVLWAVVAVISACVSRMAKEKGTDEASIVRIFHVQWETELTEQSLTNTRCSARWCLRCGTTRRGTWRVLLVLGFPGVVRYKSAGSYDLFSPASVM